MDMVFRKSPLATMLRATVKSELRSWANGGEDVSPDAGKLVTDELVIALVKERIAGRLP